MLRMVSTMRMMLTMMVMVMVRMMMMTQSGGQTRLVWQGPAWSVGVGLTRQIAGITHRSDPIHPSRTHGGVCKTAGERKYTDHNIFNIQYFNEPSRSFCENFSMDSLPQQQSSLTITEIWG